MCYLREFFHKHTIKVVMTTELNEALKQLRIQAGLTQKQVADMLSLDRSSYSYYETGKSLPTVTSLKRLSTLYGVSMDTMMGGHQNRLEEEIASSMPMQAFSVSGQDVRAILLAAHNMDKEAFEAFVCSILQPQGE